MSSADSQAACRELCVRGHAAAHSGAVLGLAILDGNDAMLSVASDGHAKVCGRARRRARARRHVGSRRSGSYGRSRPLIRWIVTFLYVLTSCLWNWCHVQPVHAQGELDDGLSEAAAARILEEIVGGAPRAVRGDAIAFTNAPVRLCVPVPDGGGAVAVSGSLVLLSSACGACVTVWVLDRGGAGMRRTHEVRALEHACRRVAACVTRGRCVAQFRGHAAAIGALAVTAVDVVVSGDADGVLLCTAAQDATAPHCLAVSIGASVTCVAVREAAPVRGCA